MPSDTTAAIDNALLLLIGLVFVVIVALLVTARRCIRLVRRQRGYHDGTADDGEPVTEQDLIEAKALYRYLEQSNREIFNEVDSLRAMQVQTRSQLKAIKEAVAKVKQNCMPPVEAIKDD